MTSICVTSKRQIQRQIHTDTDKDKYKEERLIASQSHNQMGDINLCDARIHKYTNTQIHTNTHKYTQIHKYTTTQGEADSKPKPQSDG